MQFFCIIFSSVTKGQVYNSQYTTFYFQPNRLQHKFDYKNSSIDRDGAAMGILRLLMDIYTGFLCLFQYYNNVRDPNKLDVV